MEMKLEEAIQILKSMQSYMEKDEDELEAIEIVLNYIKILERATDNKYSYVVGGRTLYNRLSELKKEDLIKAYLRLRNEVNQHIKGKENSIPKKKIEDKKQWLEENILENDYASELDKDIAEYQVNILEELLEG